jgi:hypothetical protein
MPLEFSAPSFVPYLEGLEPSNILRTTVRTARTVRTVRLDGAQNSKCTVKHLAADARAAVKRKSRSMRDACPSCRELEWNIPIFCEREVRKTPNTSESWDVRVTKDAGP